MFRRKILHKLICMIRRRKQYKYIINIASIEPIFMSFHHEIDKLKSILYKNSYTHNLVDKSIKEFLDKILAPKSVVSAVPKKNLVIALPYLSKLCLQIRTGINRIMKNKLPYYNIRFVFQTTCKISNFFTFKDKSTSFLRSDIV